MVVKPNDVICRRIPIAFLNKDISKQVLPRVVELMGKENKWNEAKKKAMMEEALS